MTKEKSALPPGFRFHPTDVELIMYYLRRRIMGKRLRFEAIAELDLYKFAPWDLPDKSLLRSRDLEWYFFCPRDKKYANGSRTNRATGVGHWKTTGKDRPIRNKDRIIGQKKTLIFHIGRVPKEDRTNWVMHEYRIEDTSLVQAGFSQDSYVLCKIFEKSGAGPKNGEQHGAPYEEEEWDDDDAAVECLMDCFSLGCIPPSSLGLPDRVFAPQPSTDNIVENYCASLEPVSCQRSYPDGSVNYPFLEADENLESLLAQFGDEDAFCGNGYSNNEITGLCNPDAYVCGPPCSIQGIFSGLEELSPKSCPNPTVSTSLGDGYVLDQPLVGDDVSYLELDDLRYPIDFSENINPVHAIHGFWDNSTLDGNIPVYPNSNEFAGAANMQGGFSTQSAGQGEYNLQSPARDFIINVAQSSGLC